MTMPLLSFERVSEQASSADSAMALRASHASSEARSRALREALRGGSHDELFSLRGPAQRA